MKSLVIKRSIVIAGHKTSVSLEDMFWTGLKDIAERQHVTLSRIVGDINTQRRQGNLSSAIRLFVLDQFRKLATDQVSKGRRDYAGDSARAASGDAVLGQG